MPAPTLSDLQLTLHDLFTKRAHALKGSVAWSLYEPLLKQQLAALDALPPALLGPKALSEDLAATDLTHDGFGGAAYHLLEAYLRVPTASTEVKAIAQRLRDTFIPELRELLMSHADESANARKRRALLADAEADLKRFPVMGAEGSEKKHLSLYDWITGQLDAGDKLGALLSGRADMAPSSRAAAAGLRNSSLGALNRFRTALNDEASANPKLPADLDAQVFGYFDLLSSMRSSGSAAEAPVPPDDPPAPVPTPS